MKKKYLKSALELAHRENICHVYAMKLMEDKLKEFMTEAEYRQFSVEVAKAMWQKEIELMPDGDFKQFCEDSFEETTKSIYDEEE